MRQFRCGLARPGKSRRGVLGEMSNVNSLLHVTTCRYNTRAVFNCKYLEMSTQRGSNVARPPAVAWMVGR